MIIAKHEVRPETRAALDKFGGFHAGALDLYIETMERALLLRRDQLAHAQKIIQAIDADRIMLRIAKEKS